MRRAGWDRRATTVIVGVALVIATGRVAVGEPARHHGGGHVRFSVGPSVTPEDSGALMFGLAVGHSLVRDLILFGDVQTEVGRRMHYRGAYGSIGVGLGVAYYLVPADAHVAASFL